MTLHLKNNDGEQILFVYAVESLSPEEIHIELSTAIDKERERQTERLRTTFEAAKTGG